MEDSANSYRANFCEEPCEECGKHWFFKRNGKCVECTQRDIARKSWHKERASAVYGGVMILPIEREVMAKVRYEDIGMRGRLV